MNDTSPAWEVVGSPEQGPPPLHYGAPWTIAAYELLRERGNLTLNEVLAEVGHTIPPGRAYREVEGRRRSQSRRYHDGTAQPRQIPTPLEDIVRTGRRQILYDTLRQLTLEGGGQRLFKHVDEDGTLRFEFNPNWTKKPRHGSRS